MTIAVDYATLGLSSDLLRRQADHAGAMGTYVRRECSLDEGELGLLLGAFHPLNECVVEGAVHGVRGLRSIAVHGADALGATTATYVETDRQAHAQLARLATTLGTSVPDFHDPRGQQPTLRLGAGAPSDHGDGEPSALQQLWSLPADTLDGARDIAGAAWDRGRGLAGAGAVAERDDASSYLVPPVGKTSEIDRVRWSAGPLIGGVDWVFQQLFGYSLLEDVILKPLMGNWSEVHQVSAAWENVGAALLAMGGNVTGLSSQTFGWRGEAADAFRLMTAAAGAAVIGLSYAADVVAGVVGTIGTVAELAAKGIGAALSWIVTKLTRMAVEASVPIAGWIVAGAEAALMVFEITKWVRRIYALFNLIVDAIEDAVEARVKLARAALAVEDVLEGFGRRAAQAVA